MRKYFFVFTVMSLEFLIGLPGSSLAQIKIDIGLSSHRAQQVFSNIVSGTKARSEFGSSPNPVGSGARAIGMGGAFIAVADDATAASWNPAGLIHLARPEISVVGAYRLRTEDIFFSINPESSGEQSVAQGELNYLSASYPFTFLNRGMIVSIAYQHLFDFARQWDFARDFTVDPGIRLDSRIRHDQEGSLGAFGFSYGLRLTRGLACGFTVNLWENALNQNEWEQTTSLSGIGRKGAISFQYNYHDVQRYSLSGVNYNLGLLWSVNNALTLGAVVKTPFTAEIEHERLAVQSILPPYDLVATISQKDREKLDMPLSYGIGLAYRFSDALSAAFDIYRTQWDDFIHTDARGNKTSFISRLPESVSDVDPTTQVRLGVEYLFITSAYVIPLRAGVFYDPAPAETHPDDIYGFSLGSGIAFGRYLFDVAYQFRYGSDIGSSLVRGIPGDFAEDVAEHAVYSSVIVHF